MSVRLRSSSGGSGGGASAEKLLEETIREVFESFSRGLGGSSQRDIPGLNARVRVDNRVVNYDDAGNMVQMPYLYVGFTDMMVDEKTGKLVRDVVAGVDFAVRPAERPVRLAALFTIRKPPVTWRPPPSLSLLPAAFNAALSVSGAGELLERELGLRLRARSASFRRMFFFFDFYFYNLKRRPVVLVDFDVNGKPLTLRELSVRFEPEGGEAVLEFDALLRHGDRKLAKRLYMIAWLMLRLENALIELSEEKGYDYEGFLRSGSRFVYVLDLGDRKVEVESLSVPSIQFFDEEYLVTSVYHGEVHRGEDLAEKLEEKARKKLKEIEQESSRTLTMLFEDTQKLMHSKDPREKELGILLALLIKKAYEEAERAIPG